LLQARTRGTTCGWSAPVREPGMTQSFDRRWVLQFAGAASLAAAGLPAALAATANSAAPFADPTLAEVMTALGISQATSPAVTLDVPAIADDGAVVPVSIVSAIPGTAELLIFVDVNPQPLALRFTVPGGTEPYLATRIRMAASGTVLAAARTSDGTLHVVAQRVQVAVGGCG